jgi:hypothetical protein
MIRNVVPDAGVVPALRLGESAGLYDLLEEALTVDSPNATTKTTCVVGGMPLLTLRASRSSPRC